MGNKEAVLIAAISGRALAASARRGDYLPLVADFFGDQDTLNAANAHIRLPGDLARGMDENALLSALEALSERRELLGRELLGLVWGTGFEDRTEILKRLAERWRLLGNDAETVAKVKDPQTLCAICASLDIPFPELSLVQPPSAGDWLAKRQGGAGGGHVRADLAANVGGRIYYQQKVPGCPISALFLADGKRALVLGFSAQWSLPAPSQPYRYGGAVRPAGLGAQTEDALSAAVGRLAAAMTLVGLNSADFLVDGGRFWLLEINPRPGATLDIFELPGGSLFALHVAACNGTLPPPLRYPDHASAAAIVYAEDDIAIVPALEWPDWTADRPVAGSAVKAGEPLCTVYASSQAAAQARALAEERRKTILAWTRGTHELHT
jgi:predicted ATP-grasp superfamily ATP-dependent carboligase